MSKKQPIQNESATVNLIRAVLSTEVKFIIGVVGFVMGVVAPYYQMKQDVSLIQASIANINSNHEAHIQDLTQQMKDMLVQVQHNQQNIQNLQTQNAVILEKISK